MGKIDMGTLPHYIGYAVRRTQLVIFEDFAFRLGEIGLKPTQFSALFVISKNPGRTQSDLSKALGIQRTNFVAMMDEFEKRGFAQRVASPTDKRSHSIYILPFGAEKLQQAIDAVDEQERHYEGKITKAGKKELLKLLKVMRS